MTARSLHTRAALVAVALSLTATGGCSLASSSKSSGSDLGTGATGTAVPASRTSEAVIASNIRPGARNVDLGRRIRLVAQKGIFQSVRVTGAGGSVRGRMSADKTRWVSTTPLRSASRYRVVGAAVDAAGLRRTYDGGFRTRALRLEEQTYPSFMPRGGTVGVGMPVIIRFDVPVTDRASIERHLRVVSRPAQVGAFRWISDKEVHWRPRTYWRPGTAVTVRAHIAGVSAGNGIYGQENRVTSFRVGPSMVSRVDIVNYQMKVYRNGRLVRTIPVTTGKQPKYTTRSGIKVIVEKFRRKRMNSATIGIDPNSPDGYNLANVEYAMRLTYSGEFLHSAPWSVSSQGRANVSHGCTGMSPANAKWLFKNSAIGDVVLYTGTTRKTDLTNGFGDWNLSFADYKAGSALS